MMTPNTPRTGVLFALILVLSAAWHTNECHAQEETIIAGLIGRNATKIGNRAVFLMRPASEGRSNLYALDSGSTVPWPVLWSEDALRYVGRRPGMWVDPSSERVVLDGAEQEVVPGSSANVLVAVDLNSSTAQVLVDNGRHNREPAFSPDGSKLAFYSARPNFQIDPDSSIEGFGVRVKDLRTGKEIEVAKPGFTFFFPSSPPAWSPDGEHLAFLSAYIPQGRRHVPGILVCVVQPDGNGLRIFGENDKDSPRGACGVAWPEKHRILFTGGGRGIYELDLRSGMIELKKAGNFRSPISTSPDRKFVRVGTDDPESGSVSSIVLSSNTLEEGRGETGHSFMGNWVYPGKR